MNRVTETAAAPAEARPAGSRPRTGVPEKIDVRGLERDLARAVEGEVRFDAGARALYATDASNFRQPPIGVVVPKTLDDVVAVHKVCHRHRAPILSRGAGTSLSGETVNYAVVIDHSKYLRRILDFDPGRRLVTVENGAVNEQVNLHTGTEGLVFAPDPSTHAYCTIGGNVGNNSCGIHSVQAAFEGDGARTSDNVHSLDVVTYDGVRMQVGQTSDEALERVIAAGGRTGQIYRDLRALRDRYADLIRKRFPKIPRRVSGYNLDDLLPEKGFNLASALCGTEGTCATVLTATLKLVPNPKCRAIVAIGFDDVCAAAERVPDLLEHRPIALEGIDHRLFENQMRQHMHTEVLRELPGGRAWLLVEFGGETRREAEERATKAVEGLRGRSPRPADYKVYSDPREERKLWEVREAGLGATAFPPGNGDHWPGWEDSAVHPRDLAPYIRDLQKLYAKYGYTGALYGHFGQGCLHSRISFDLRSQPGVRKYRSFLEEAADLVAAYGGSLSGEHGDGQQRGELLPRMYGPELVEAFREFKRIWDPDWKMNPGKVVDSYRLDEDLKLGAGTNPWRPQTKFAWPEDGGDYAHATLRCVGVGKCRTPGGVDVMCPSYMVLKEEKHTTRGRARLLFEMLQGDVVTDGWRSREVKEALDLCLACKGCTNDCPVQVDMPAHKAEFLHHHWKGRLRPRHAYAFGLIDRVSRLASLQPGLVNALTHTPPFGQALRLLAGMSAKRSIPRFAPLTLRDWFFARPERNPSGPTVLLWPDTFNNYFHTDVGVAAVEALEAAGWRVTMPRPHVCCGRPLYDYGFLDLAKRYLDRVLEELRPAIRAGVPVVGMEPSCLATFKSELPRLFPHDDDARRLRDQSYHFAAFLKAHDVRLPRLRRKALVWGHCHQKATGGIEADLDVLERMGIEAERVTGGCCGLAGSWGFEAGHHGISMECGEQALFPAIRDAEAEALIVANGFSCKTQITEGKTARTALHLAQVIEMARRAERNVPIGQLPERSTARRPRPGVMRRVKRVAALGALGGLAVAAALKLAG